MKGLWTKNAVTYSDIKEIPIPESTLTYQAVPYTDLIDSLLVLGSDMLTGFSLEKTKYGLARENQQMFGIHTYKFGISDIGLSIGFRSSYNRTLSNSVAIGGNVFVCDNLMIQGDIMVMRKHTPNVYNDLSLRLKSAFENAQDAYLELHETKEHLSNIYVSTDRGYQMLGYLYGNNILASRQLSVATKEWRTPTHKEHGKNTAWTLYNACTEALKTLQIRGILEKHQILDAKFKEICPN